MEKEQISFFDFQGRYGREEYRSLRENGMYYPESLEQGCMGFRKSLLEKDISPYGLHFFDCASMHFLTKFFLERLREDFILLLFDHQADVKKPEVRGLCHHSWLREVMVRLPHCKGILLLGATEEEKATINDALMTLGDEYVPMQGGRESLESRREVAARHPGVFRTGIFRLEEQRRIFRLYSVWYSCPCTVPWIRTFSGRALRSRNTVSPWTAFWLRDRRFWG